MYIYKHISISTSTTNTRTTNCMKIFLSSSAHSQVPAIYCVVLRKECYSATKNKLTKNFTPKAHRQPQNIKNIYLHIKVLSLKICCPDIYEHKVWRVYRLLAALVRLLKYSHQQSAVYSRPTDYAHKQIAMSRWT